MSSPRPPPDRDDLLDRALARVASRPPPPPPPSVARVFARIDAPRPSHAKRWLVAAGGVGLAAAAAVFALTRPSADVAPPPFQIASGSEFVRSIGLSNGGGVWLASGPATFASPVAEIAVEAGTRISFSSATDVMLLEGRAVFHVTHANQRGDPRDREFRVGAGFFLAVHDRGTTFAIDVARGVGSCDYHDERVLVTVTEGRVEAQPLRADARGVPEPRVDIGPGRGLAFVDGRPQGASWPLDAKPTLSLESEAASATAGEPVVLAIALSNPTDGWIPWPSSGGAGSPLHVEVTDPAGAVTLVRVTDVMLVDRTAVGRAIPPRGREVVRVRFDRTFASSGTYRLRAIFRPAQAVESPTSNTVSLPVRAPGGPR